MPLRGHLDFASLHTVIGWAQDSDAPDVPVSLVVSVDDKVVGRVLADRYRPDLKEAAIGSGRHAFDLRLTALSPWTRHTISVRREGDGAHLPRSPFMLEPASAFDQAAKDSIAQLLSTFASPADLEERLQFLLEQTAQLRQLRSNFQNGATDRDDRRWRMWNEASLAETGVAAGPTRRRALVVSDRIPLPDHDSQSNALLSHIQALQRLGFEVSFAPVSLTGDASQLESAGVACCRYPWFTSIEDMLRRQRDAFALVYLHRVSTAARYVALVRDHQPHARIVYGVGELLHLRQTRQAEIEQRSELAALGEHTRLLELVAARQADAVITHSTDEAAVLRHYMHPDLVHMVPWSLLPRPTPVPFADRHGLAFVGSYENQANVDAATRLVDVILPALDALSTRAPCLLVGSEMPDTLRSLRRDRVEPLGHVADLASVFDRVRLTVAPLAFGAGVRGKVLDSLAAGVPCVCTPSAAAGLDLPDALAQLVAESPADFARSIQALHDDEALNETCRDAGLAYIRAKASEAQVDAALRAAVDPQAG